MRCSPIAFQTYGDWMSVPAAMLLFLVTWAIGQLLAAWSLPAFYRIVLQSGVAVLLAGTAVHLGLLDEVPAISAAAASILLVLPIPAVVSLAEDAVTGFPGTAADRSVTVIAAFLGAVAGAVLASAVVRDLVLDDTWTHVATFPLPALGAVAAGIVGALGNALFNNGPLRLLWPAAIAGLVAGSINMLGQRELGLPGILTVAVAAVALGALANLLAGVARVPASAIVVTGVTGALLPGLDVVRGLTLELSSRGAGVEALLSALATTAVIGVGVVLGVLAVSRTMAGVAASRVPGRAEDVGGTAAGPGVGGRA